MKFSAQISNDNQQFKYESDIKEQETSGAKKQEIDYEYATPDT